MDKLGVSYEYETTVILYIIQHNYTPDFLLPSGIILEAKAVGILKTEGRSRVVKTQNPELDLRMVFQTPYNKISKRSKTTLQVV